MVLVATKSSEGPAGDVVPLVQVRGALLHASPNSDAPKPII